MRIEITHAGLLVYLANHYTTWGAQAKWVECLPMVRETGVQSQIESYPQKMVFDAALLNIQYYKVKRSNPRNGVVAIEKGAFGSPLTKVANFTFTYFINKPLK